MSDWVVGDLALCVDGSPCRCGHCAGIASSVDAGKIYRVAGVSHDREVFLTLSDHAPLIRHLAGIIASRFRKIVPDKHEPCEAEFVTLLKRGKVRA